MNVSLKGFHKLNKYTRPKIICWKNVAQDPYNELPFQNQSGAVRHSPQKLIYASYGLRWYWFIESYRSLS